MNPKYVTQWFCKEDPLYAGVYQCVFRCHLFEGGDELYAYFNGEKWFRASQTIDGAFSNFEKSGLLSFSESRTWRGIAE